MATTLTDESAMASAAIAGDSVMPNAGQSTPAAIGKAPSELGPALLRASSTKDERQARGGEHAARDTAEQVLA